MLEFVQRAALMALTLIVCACAPASWFGSTLGTATTDPGRQSFEWRRQHGSGQYLDESELAAARSLSLTELFQARFRGFQMPADALDSPVRNTTLPAIASKCPTQVYLNGALAPTALEGNLRPTELFGAEYYSTSTAPPQFVRAWKTCPVLLLWLRR